jgi:diguanylate cyclase (GGDEF)-like protein
MVPVGLVLLAAAITNHTFLLNRRAVLFLLIEPILTLLLIWTDDWHGLFFGGSFTTGLIISGGPWFYLNLVYSYGLVLAVTVLISWYQHRSALLQRRQMGIILLGYLLPWLGNLLTVLRISPFTGLDLTPFLFIISGVIYAIGLFYFRLLDVIPFAHNLLITSLPDGVIVLDADLRILEVNAAACELTGVSLESPGKPARQVFEHYSELLALCNGRGPARFDLQLLSQAPRVIDVRFNPIIDQGGKLRGYLFVLHDISHRVELEERLKELSIQDGLTGLYNRRFFDDELARLERSRRQPVSLIMVDVDFLKQVNDQYGHSVGDDLLLRAANVLRSSFRAEDLIVRVGGDEFAVILPRIGATDSARVLDRLRATIASHNASHSDLVPLSMAMGSASSEQAGDSLIATLKRADAAMYEDKRSRRRPEAAAVRLPARVD